VSTPKKTKKLNRPCGTSDENIVCEKSGSKTSLAVNIAEYRFREAQKLKEKEDFRGCRLAIWHAISFARKASLVREAAMKRGIWVKGIRYLSRYEGEMTESDVFNRLGVIEDKGLALFQACGGSHEPSYEDIDDTSTLGKKE